MSKLPFIRSSHALGSNLALHPLTQSTFHYLQRRETQIFVPGLRSLTASAGLFCF